MASIKIKFRASVTRGKEGTIYYQIIHNRVARQVKTGYRIYESEWNGNVSEIIMLCSDGARAAYLSEIADKVAGDKETFRHIIESLERQGSPYTSDDVVDEFLSLHTRNTIFPFMEDVIARLDKLGKVRTSEAYVTTLSSFRRFRQDRDVALDNVNSDLMQSYEAWLKVTGVSPNSSSFYMRNLRAVYNRAVEKGLTLQRHPFRHVYTGVDKTAKRAVSLVIIKRIKEAELSPNSSIEFARDMFLFSFYTRGMSMVDMAYLRKKDLANGVLTYRRRKTGQQLIIKWEKPMQKIVDKYDTGDSVYLLPIIQPCLETDERTQYIYAGHNINRNLKIIGRKLKLSLPLTMYSARHSWASIARSKNIPLSVISAGMGHDSEATTQIYLASLDNMEIDKANSRILKSL